MRMLFIMQIVLTSIWNSSSARNSVSLSMELTTFASCGSFPYDLFQVKYLVDLPVKKSPYYSPSSFSIAGSIVVSNYFASSLSIFTTTVDEVLLFW